MRLRIVFVFILFVLLVVWSCCAGNTTVFDVCGVGAADDVVDPEGEASSGTEGSPTDTPDPSESSPEAKPSVPDDQTGWWPPAPPPTATPSGEGEEDPREPEPSEGSSSPEPEEPSEGNSGEQETPGSERYTFPNWEEHSYSSRNDQGPEKFAARKRF